MVEKNIATPCAGVPTHYLVVTPVKSRKVRPRDQSGKTPMYDSVQIEAIAAFWLARRDCEGWSAADQAEFTAWMEASIAHRVACIRLEAAGQHARRLKALAAGVRGCPGNDPESSLEAVPRIAE